MITTGFLIGIGLILAIVALYLVIMVGYIVVVIIGAIVGGICGAIMEVAAKEWKDIRKWDV